MYRGRYRRGQRGRMPKPVKIEPRPPVSTFLPIPQMNLESVHMEPAELETLRLVDLQGLSQEEAGAMMGVSRGTIWRLLQNARKKAAQALTEGRPLVIS